MGPDEGPLAGVVEVVPHQEVEQLGGLGADGAQLGVAALEGLVAQRCTQVRPPLVERRGELDGHAEAKAQRGYSVPLQPWGQRRAGDRRGPPPLMRPRTL